MSFSVKSGLGYKRMLASGTTTGFRVGSTGFAALLPKDSRDSSYLFHQLFSDEVGLPSSEQWKPVQITPP